MERDEEAQQREDGQRLEQEDEEDDVGSYSSSQPLFRPFTVESLKRIAKRVEKSSKKDAEKKKKQQTKDDSRQDPAAAAASTAAADAFVSAGAAASSGARKRAASRAEKAAAEAASAAEDQLLRADPHLEAGKQLPQKYRDFPPNLYGRPIEDLDQFYANKYTFMIVARDKTMFRFSATNAFFILSPFHVIRRTALLILTHPMFSLAVMVVILVNCVFMAINQPIPGSEETFTAIYTCEGVIKLLARGFIVADFTYLRDAWNWLDFTVVVSAYVTLGVEIGNIAVIRTFRVLRALKTVAVVPGLKTIVGALMEAVRRLRDVMILSVFVLSIFALIGLQLYKGQLRQRCIRNGDPLTEASPFSNFSDAEKRAFNSKEENWATLGGQSYILCDIDEAGGKCPANSTCAMTNINPDDGNTNFDNFGWAILCAFRLMTQDYWELLHLQVLRTNGRLHVFFFVIIIFLGSFYLVNVILAIVAMSYDDCRKLDEEEREEDLKDEEALLAERNEMEAAVARFNDTPGKGSLSKQSLMDFYRDRDQISMKSEYAVQDRLNRYGREFSKTSVSLPGSPFVGHRMMTRHRSSQLSWKNSLSRVTTTNDGSTWRPVVMPCLENRDFPYADDSNAVTPTSDDLCNSVNTHLMITNRPRLSSGGSRMAQLESRFAGGTCKQESYLLQNTHNQFLCHGMDPHNQRSPPKVTEPTHFHWRPSSKNRKQKLSSEPETPEKKKEHSSNVLAWSGCKEIFSDNPFICRTPSATSIDLQDLQIMKDLTKEVAGENKGLFGYEKGMSKKEFLKEKCMLLLFGWECTPTWYKFAHFVELFIMDAFVDLFITVCIVVNTVFMAMEHYKMGDTMTMLLQNGNYVFTAIFTLEAALKVLALGLYKYLQDKWSCFDFVIVILSLVELGLANVKGLSILRSFRLLRVFKLAKSWPTLNLLISIIGRTMGALGNLCLVLAIIVFIFAVMGMQLFGDNYKRVAYPKEDLRWHFIDFLHSFMIVFRILCGEWIENMWTCIRLNGMYCVPFFLLTMIIGNLVVLNLFLALLLSSFGAESLRKSTEEEAPNKLQEAIDRINRFTIYIKSHLAYCFKENFRHKPTPIDNFYEEDRNLDGTGDSHRDGDLTVILPPIGNGGLRETEATMKQTTSNKPHADSEAVPMTFSTGEGDDFALSLGSEPSTVKINKESPSSTYSRTPSHRSTSNLSQESEMHSRSSRDSFSSTHSLASSAVTDFFFQDDTVSNEAKQVAKEQGADEVNILFVKYPNECCPRRIMNFPLWGIFDRTLLGKIWWKMRCYAFSLVEHHYFETFIILMILASSLALAVEDKYIEEKPPLHNALKILDKVFTVIFIFEMCVKMSAYGFKRYFTDAWCWLDFIIVVISLIGWSAEDATSSQNSMGSFRALRTLRALRPLRAVSRWEGMKVVVNALIQAIPAIFNVLLVCLVFWLIFSIMGVNLFMGKFGWCVDANDTRLKLNNALNITNKTMCDANKDFNVSWFRQKLNFDNVLIGYLSLFQVATFKGWMDIMYAAIDSGESADSQPDRENKSFMYMYFVLFIVFGSFFTLNLFIGVIIENFNMQKKKAGGSMEILMTEDQKKYYNAMKKLGSKQPTKPIPKPKFAFQLFFFKLTKNQKFDVVIMIVILLNMFTMAIEHYEQSEDFATVLEYVNYVFIMVFTMEFVMKLLGLRLYYFKEPWNVFDFIVVVISILTLFVRETTLPISPTLFRVVRVFRVGRVLRLVKSAKGIRTLLFSLAVSMPALFNIGLLLCLVMFIYSIVGMSSFMHVKRTAGFDDVFNFETFFSAMIVLFQICTSAGWELVLAALMNDEDCEQSPPDNKPSDCGNSPLGIAFLVSYLVMSFLVIVNMYIAVILENFSQATEDVQKGLTQDDFDMYYEVWERFDEKATQYIPLSQLSEFADTLEEPLQLPVPNLVIIGLMDIPICEGDRVHCVDILDALTKRYLGTADAEAGELGDLKGPEKADYHPVSSTRKRQREIYVAKIIQRTWRNYVKRRLQKRSTEEYDPEKNEEEAMINDGVTEETRSLTANFKENFNVKS